jgi:uncharacterized protein YjiS (DUF1127 family)
MTTTTCTRASCLNAQRRITPLRLIRLAFAAHSQRRALQKLDMAALNDLGLTAQQAETEANRPFWDVPATWRA